MKQMQLTMFKSKTKKRATIYRLNNVCKLINQGLLPRDAATELNFSQHYITLMIKVNIIKKVNGKYIAMQKIQSSRYKMFIDLRNKYNEKHNGKTIKKIKPVKNNTTFIRQIEKPKNWLQKFITKLFNL